MNKIIAIVQARIGSSRLPGKVLLNLEGKTILEHVIERVRNSRFVKEVIVATTILKEDLKIVNLCASRDIRVYCGSENDVLDRYYQAARLLGASHIVRITADCPLMDAKVIDKVIGLHLSKKTDYTSTKENFPDGLDVEVFTFEVLRRCWKNARLSSEREHVTAYIKKHPKLFKFAYLSCAEDFSQKRWTLDEKRDFRFIKLIYKNLYKKNRLFGMDEVLTFLDLHPEYERINYLIKRNKGYAKSLKQDKILNIDYT